MRHLTVPILRSGALVEVRVGLSGARRKVLVHQQQPVPPEVSVSLLVDTGASTSLIDTGPMRALQLTPTGATQVHSASTAGVAKACDMFDISLVLGAASTQTLWRVDPLAVIADAFINQPFDGLLGRDVLERVQLGWNGPGRQLTISYP